MVWGDAVALMVLAGELAVVLLLLLVVVVVLPGLAVMPAEARC